MTFKITGDAVYLALAASRNTDATLRWSRAQIFLVLNSGLLAAIPLVWNFQFLHGFHRNVSLLFIAGSGLLLSIIWLLITNRANQWIEFWNERLAAAELGDSELQVRTFSHEEFKKQHRTAPSFHQTLAFLAGVFAVGWFCAGMVFLTLTVNSFERNAQPPLPAPPIVVTPSPTPPVRR